MNSQELITSLERMGFENIGDPFSVTMFLEVPYGHVFVDFNAGDGKPLEAYIKIRTRVCQIPWEEGPYPADEVRGKVDEGVVLISLLQEWIEKLENLTSYQVDSLRLEKASTGAVDRPKTPDKEPWMIPWQKLKAAKPNLKPDHENH